MKLVRDARNLGRRLGGRHLSLTRQEIHLPLIPELELLSPRNRL